jgi:ABC-type nickel/cobalt efflux system permease component RcnA
MIAAALVGLTLALGVPAHPLGNFTVNQYAGLRVSTVGVEVDHVVDMAELAAFQVRDDVKAGPEAWAATTCGTIAHATSVTVAGRAATLTVTRSSVAFLPGQGGLDTLRLECVMQAAATISGETAVTYRSTVYDERIGWREVTAIGSGVTLTSSDVPTQSVSARLTSYPVDQALDVRTANLVARPGGPIAAPGGVDGAPGARGVDRLTAAFTSFVGRPDLTLGLGLIAILLALVLGGAHAFAPGHGKTVLAAYLVSERGSLRHAMVVAGTVTATHTAGVLVLGVVLTTSLTFAPDRLYAWLGVLSGLLLAGVGAAMLRRARRTASLVGDHHHHHHHDHDHSHDHDHGDGHHHHHHHGPLRLRSLVTMGFAGGLAPSPSAVVVLLGAVALGRTWFGVLLVLGYGIGMAAALMLIGVALARWRGVLERRVAGRAGSWLRRAVPVATAALVLFVGLGLAVRSVSGVI